MASSQHPKFSIEYGWNLGENGWNSGMDDNLRDLALFTQLVVNGITNASPGSPSNGETHIVGGSPSGNFGGHAGEVAIYLDGAWVFYIPIEGYIAFNKADDLLYYYASGNWSSYAPAGSGDMVKSQYDSNDDGVVDSADKVEGVDSASASYYYGKNASGVVGFHPLPASAGIADGSEDGHVPVWDTDSGAYVPTQLGTSQLRISVSAAGVMNHGETIAIYQVTEPVTLPQNLVGSVAYAIVAPTAAMSINIAKNGTTVGTIDFAAGSKTPTFTFASDVSYAVGDRIGFYAPNPVDLAIEDFMVTLVARL